MPIKICSEAYFFRLEVEILKALLPSSILVTCPAHLNLLDLITSSSSLLLLLLLSMLLISRSLDLWTITGISSLCLINKLPFPSFSIFNFLFLPSISSYVFQIMKELCTSSSYSFLFRHLPFSGIMKKVISS